MPFGGGPRFCPGRYLAILEAKMVLTTTLAAFDLAASGDAVHELMGMTMQPDGLNLRLSVQRPTRTVQTNPLR
jgi:cytochrome P450